MKKPPRCVKHVHTHTHTYTHTQENSESYKRIKDNYRIHIDEKHLVMQ